MLAAQEDTQQSSSNIIDIFGASDSGDDSDDDSIDEDIPPAIDEQRQV